MKLRALDHALRLSGGELFQTGFLIANTLGRQIIRGFCSGVVDSGVVEPFFGALGMYTLSDFNPVPTESVIPVHLVLLIFSIGAVVAAYWRSNRPVHELETLIWFVGTGAFTVMAIIMGSFFSEPVRRLVFGYIFFVWAVAAFGICVTWMRKGLPRDDPRSTKANGSQVFTALGFVLVLGLLIAVLFPGAPHTREHTWRTQCKYNLKQIGLAFANAQDSNGRFPGSANDDPPHSWRIAILPFTDHSSLHSKYDFSTAWDSTSNELVATIPVLLYQCPSRAYLPDDKLVKDPQGRYFSHMAMINGAGTVGSGVTSREIKDGTSSTLMVVEACGLDIVWTEPRDVNIDSQPVGVNLPSPTPGMSPGWVSSHHRGGAHVLLADGSVRFIDEKINPEILKSLMTINGRDAVDDF